VERGGSAARLAHRDLDAVCALFETAARNEAQRGHTSVAAFLASLVAQQIPADTLADRGIRGDAVRLLTAHRAKGLEWRMVVVAHVQEDTWPDLRRRATLLRADRIGAQAYAEPVLVPDVSARELLAEERRLFYVACTRARERLVVTAVASPDDDGEKASRFLAELGLDVVHQQGRPARPMSLTGLVAELRRTAADPASTPGLRAAAVRRLARLSRERVGSRPLVPAADPVSWWGTRGLSQAATPVRPAERPVTLSASTVAAVEECPAKWFLEREAGGARETSQAQGFGNLVHALADQVVDGDLADADPDVEALMEHVDTVWGQLQFRTPWSGAREREEIRKALGRFLDWHRRAEARKVLATEQDLHAEVTLPDGQQVVLRGRVDRLELDAGGRVVVVDLKTGKYPPSDTSLPENPQLGFYQHAVEHGAADELVPGAEPGGAELWQLRRQDRSGRLKVQHQPPQQPGDDGHRPIELQLMQAARAIRDEEFPARPGKACERCAFEPLCPARNAGTVLQ
jgi:ATP-dependent exoDNAse (exonuclease V) beta subunit